MVLRSATYGFLNRILVNFSQGFLLNLCFRLIESLFIEPGLNLQFSKLPSSGLYLFLCIFISVTSFLGELLPLWEMVTVFLNLTTAELHKVLLYHLFSSCYTQASVILLEFSLLFTPVMMTLSCIFIVMCLTTLSTGIP